MRNANLIDLAFFLKKTQLFGSLDLEILLSIVDKMEIHHFKAMDVVFNYSQEAYRMYVILAGQIAIYDEEKKEKAVLLPGDYFGEEALFNEQRRHYKASCKTKAELLSISRAHLLSILHAFPSVAIALLESYTLHTPFRLR